MSKLFIGGLSWSTDEQSLTEHFEKYGKIETAFVVKDRETGRSRGYGFVQFEETQDEGTTAEACADAAIAEMNDSELDGRNIRVDKATAREGGGRGGGFSRGGGRGGFGRGRGGGGSFGGRGDREGGGSYRGGSFSRGGGQYRDSGRRYDGGERSGGERQWRGEREGSSREQPY
ncbi:hypothetical protein VSDG_00908 [Cytospora chrysosperma]|uniref:RRM domain-containing protein n=1 Tax=Cytospora chrysosperma TaxID=252740 RepID=A0A423WLL5_CYTCH|nr:hypothetical protein VSDG_00908 [Valsa sordida]